MRTAIRLSAIVLLAAPVFAADHPDFRLWKAGELTRRDAALSKNVGPDHSARETLADFGDHRVRFLYRNADGFPEQHDTIVDLVFVQSGEGVLQLGGTMIDKKATGSPGDTPAPGSTGDRAIRLLRATSFTSLPPCHTRSS